MDQLQSLLLAWVVGLVSGFVITIPLGPINLTIINEGARRGFLWGLMIGFGAVTMDAIYCFISFAGFATVFDSRLVKATMELLSFMLMVFLGFKFMFLHSVPSTSRSAERVEEKLHPHSAFMTGFVRVLGNPGVLVLWITVTGAFTANDWVSSTWLARSICIMGIAMGAMSWFVLLSYLVSLKHKQLSANTLIRMSQISGGFLLLLAVVIGIKIVFLLSKHPGARPG